MNILIHKVKKHHVKHLNVNVNASIIFLLMVLTTLNVYVNIHTRSMISIPENVQERNVRIVMVLQVRGLVHVDRNSLIMLLFWKLTSNVKPKENLSTIW